MAAVRRSHSPRGNPAAQPAPAGRRVAIVSNAGGPGIVCADACQADGLDVIKLPAQVRRRLAALLPAGASLANPIDILATASGEHYRQAIGVLIDAGACDAIVTIYVPPLGSAGSEVAREIGAAARSARGVALASVFMGSAAPAQRPGEPRVPRFGFPEDAARALAHAARYGRWRAVADGSPRGRSRHCWAATDCHCSRRVSPARQSPRRSPPPSSAARLRSRRSPAS
jgi:acetate---CoA ligase (ADP-forming)